MTIADCESITLIKQSDSSWWLSAVQMPGVVYEQIGGREDPFACLEELVQHMARIRGPEEVPSEVETNSLTADGPPADQGLEQAPASRPSPRKPQRPTRRKPRR